MVKKIKWSPEAFEDLKEITDYIKKDSPSYAGTIAEKILDSAKQIIQYPEAGRMVPEINIPVAKLVPYPKDSGEKRPIGLAEGDFEVPDDFFDPLPDDILDYFTGEGIDTPVDKFDPGFPLVA